MFVRTSEVNSSFRLGQRPQKRSNLLRMIHSFLIGDLRDNRCYLVCNFFNMNFDFFHSRDQITPTMALFSDEVDLGRIG